MAPGSTLTSLLTEYRLRQDRQEAFSHYGGFVRHFSDEPPPARHHNYLIDKLDQVALGEIKRLMVFMPPGSAKSTYASILFPPYWLEKNPRKMIIGASHSGELAERFGRKVRNIVGDDQYLRYTGTSLRADSQAAGRWETTRGSEYYAVGVKGSVTGRRGDLGLIDDPVKGREEAESEVGQNRTWEWYLSDFRTRLKPTAALVIIMTRWVEYDLAGRILPEDYDFRSGKVIARDGEEWEVVCLPMEAEQDDALGRNPGELLWPDWFTPEWVEQEKRTQGTRNWNSLFQQRPTAEDGDYYQKSWFKYYDQLPERLNYYIAGDYAVSEGEGDFTELGVFGVDPDDNIYIVDWYSAQAEVETWVDELIDMARRYRPMMSIGETGVIRRAVEAIIKRKMRESRLYFTLEWLPHNRGDKPAMGRTFQALAQQGRVHIPRTQWAEDLLSQLAKFPNGRYDDKADACALFGRKIDEVWAAYKPKETIKQPIRGANELTLNELYALEKRYSRRGRI